MVDILDIALNAADHDLLLANVDLLLIDNAERVAQQIKIQHLTWLGEWFLDITHGMPYLENILVKNPNLAIIRQIFINQTLQVPDVVKIEKLDLFMDKKNRALQISYTARTNYGLVERKELLGYGK